MNLQIIKKFGELQEQLYEETGCSDNMAGFESEDGQFIINPFKSECLRFDVEPVEYYGEKRLKKFWVQLIK